MIPEGNWSLAGLSLITTFTDSVNRITSRSQAAFNLSTDNRPRNHQKFSNKQASPHPIPITTSIEPPPSVRRQKPKPWSDRSDRLKLFAEGDEKETEAESNTQSRWRSAVTCDWPDKNRDIRGMASDIARASQLDFTPSLIPFGAERALFFCSSPSEANKIIAMGIVRSHETIVSLNRRHEFVNTVDPSETKF